MEILNTRIPVIFQATRQKKFFLKATFLKEIEKKHTHTELFYGVLLTLKLEAILLW